MTLEIFQKRISVRNFLDKEVEKDKLMKIIEAGNLAPSACDFQEWRVILLDNEIKKKIVNEGAASFIKYAPICMVVTYSNQTDNPPDHIQSASAFIENMLLMAASLGIYGCWVCHLPPKDKMKEILHIPKEYDPIAVIVFGYPKTIPKPKSRKHTVEEIISYNKFNFGIIIPQKENLNFRKFARKIYYLLPIFIRKRLNPIVDKKFERKF